jgi:hypothetical protein
MYLLDVQTLVLHLVADEQAAFAVACPPVGKRSLLLGASLEFMNKLLVKMNIFA